MPINTGRWNQVRYSLYAPVYDALVAFLAPARHRSIRLLDPRPGERVLVVGSGTGLDLPLLPAGVRVLAADITPAMARRAAARARALQPAGHAAVMDGRRLALPDASFDCVILHLILAVTPDPSHAAQEAARVLRPGGRAVIFDKFVPEGRRPPLLRRLLNPAMNLLASDLTRQLEPILADSGLVLRHREPAALGAAFEIALAVKT